jgi:hypothetical protein
MKAVVHSSKEAVTSTFHEPRLCAASLLFHNQVVDFQENISFGTFFTIVDAVLVTAAFRRYADTTCTDLSTIDVDKREFSFDRITCVKFVTKRVAMRGNCIGRFVSPPR